MTVIASLPARKDSTVLDAHYGSLDWLVWEAIERPAWSGEFDSREEAAEWLASVYWGCGKVRTLTDGTVQVRALGVWHTVRFDKGSERE
jgi:hypothetical protein